ncbi:hypothetical protein ALT761_01882 [Alteromonas sp. 76-1]|jgi:hypothetical protein|uniref:DUF6953 family protein n=1 Tax=Alteromonas sp. 76-1 TaxID=2358187 RepID=UPI000FD173F4|nr:hypothetical protein [Alteromonas sp. 76-1]VEL96889.1 hypothetical protein ALT761_01882 [Alteromonas sp. 76-1]
MASTKDVAQWMLDEIDQNAYLEQGGAVYTIHEKFGDEFVYTNDNGNLAIAKKVLTAFNKLSGDSVVWLRGEKAWVPRQEHHYPGRQQD